MASYTPSRAPRYMSDKLVDLHAEVETCRYRRGIIMARIKEFEKAGDTKNASIYKNRYEEVVKLEKEIKQDIFNETRKLFNEK